MAYPWGSTVTDAITRLAAVVGGTFTGGNHRTNFVPRLQDVGTVADAIADAADYANTKAVAAAASETAASGYAARMGGTSVSSVTIGTGEKAFTTQASKFFEAGRDLLFVDANDSANRMWGYSTAYSGTGLTAQIIRIEGSGTITSWNIYVTGVAGSPHMGYQYIWNDNTANSDPTVGKIKINHADPASATALYISETDARGSALASILAIWGQNARGRLRIVDVLTPTDFVEVDIASAVTDNGGWDGFTIAYRNHGDAMVAGTTVAVEFVPKGDTGATGATGIQGLTGSTGRMAGLPYTYKAVFTAGDPGAGCVRVNNASFAAATAIYISETDGDGKGITKLLQWAAQSTSGVKGLLTFFKASAVNNWVSFDITGSFTDNGGWDTIVVTHRDGEGTIADDDSLLLHVDRVGDKGDTGATGSTGSTGLAGAIGPSPTNEFDWDAGTTDANPGGGKMRVDNGTYADVTRIYVNNADRSTGSVAAWVDSWDDIASSAGRGHVDIKGIDDPNAWLKVKVTGIVTDATTYRKVVVSYVGHYGTLSGRVSVLFTPSGEDGEPGEGSGNVNYDSGTPAAGRFVVAGPGTNEIQDGGAFTAATIPNAPTGGITATNVQAALNELDTDKASAANASLTGTTEIAQAHTMPGDISPSQITADQNNYAPTGFATCSVIRLDSDAARNLTGLAGGADGRRVLLFNVGSFAITLKDENGSSTAGNRFALYADLILYPEMGAWLLYDSTSSRWRAEKSNSAAEIAFTPTGNIAATNVAAALSELDSEKIPLSYLDTDISLAANSDSKIATQKATKAYADALIAANDAMVFKGVIDCSANPNYPAADRGHTYRVSVAGKIGGGSGPNVEAGDILLCLTDSTASGDHATVGSNWAIIQVNLDGAVIGPSSVTDERIAVFDGTTGKLLKQASVAVAGLQPIDATLTALAAHNSNGLLTQTAADTFTGRTLTAGTGVSVSNGAGTAGNPTVAIDKASSADVRAAVSNKVLTADLIESAAAYVALTDASTVAVDWDAGVNFSLTVTANRAIGNPTNGQPGTSRTVLVQGDSSTDRTITFGNQYLGDLPTITDCDSTKWYELTIVCHTTSHFTVTSHVAKKP